MSVICRWLDCLCGHHSIYAIIDVIFVDGATLVSNIICRVCVHNEGTIQVNYIALSVNAL